ncbi:MAG: N-acetylmuramoyl-L-alanine amidase [Nocardioidaceae bacterium]
MRTRSDHVWSDWQTLEVDDAAAGPGSRPATEPLWVGSADGIAARVSTVDGRTPAGVEVAMIDPGESTVPAAEPAATSPRRRDSGARDSDRPEIVTRSQWGADPDLTTTCDSPYRIPTMKGVVVHHSAGSNSYSRSDAASVVRGIYAYHTVVQNWCDIGYNFLVDKYGTIYEGRKGSIEYQVRASHAGNWDVNIYATGVSMIGNYDLVQPTTALKTSVVNLIAWRLGVFGVNAKGTMTFGGIALKTIAGHRDVYTSGIRPATSTACPGRYGYAWLGAAGGLRDRVAARMEGEQAPVLPESVRKVYANHKADLGKRISDVKDSSVKGLRFVNYNKGRIYLHAGEASALWGLVDDKYRPLGKSAATLGFPTSSIRTTSSATFANFSHGRIYRHSKKAFSLWGDIESRHQALEGVRGVLGRPTSSVKVSPSGRLRANFGQARVYAYRRARVCVVGAHLRLVREAGRHPGRAGCPDLECEGDAERTAAGELRQRKGLCLRGQGLCVVGERLRLLRCPRRHPRCAGCPDVERQAGADGTAAREFRERQGVRLRGQGLCVVGSRLRLVREAGRHPRCAGCPDLERAGDTERAADARTSRTAGCTPTGAGVMRCGEPSSTRT